MNAGQIAAVQALINLACSELDSVQMHATAELAHYMANTLDTEAPMVQIQLEELSWRMTHKPAVFDKLVIRLHDVLVSTHKADPLW